MKARLRDELGNLIRQHKALEVAPKSMKMRSSLEKKRVVIDEIKRLLRTYNTLLIVDNTGVPSKLFLYMRQRYGSTIYVKLVKNTLLLRALKELGMPNVDELAKYLKGSNIAVFTKLNAFEAKLLLDKISVPYKIKPGERIEHEIVVPSMRTELKPGPIMSLFGRLKIPIQVRDGVIWIMKEASIAKPGDTATPELISLFDKLGIEPKLLKPRIKVAYEKGLIIPAESLVVDIEGTKNSIVDAAKDALLLAVELVIPETTVLRMALSRACARASALAIELGVITRETAPMTILAVLRRAYALASALAPKIPELALVSTQATATEAKITEEKTEKKTEEGEKKEEKEGVSEEHLAEGLAALFG